jgi:hypothetical protein
VKTPDCRVAVTGTVFSVNSGIKGSRVGVLQGSVHVMHAGVDSLMHAGDQVATNDNMSPAPVEQQIPGARIATKYLPLLAQFSILQHRLKQIPSPQLRYTSDLLDRVPAETLLYVSIPNLGISERGEQDLSGSIEAKPGAAAVVESGHATTPRIWIRWWRSFIR